MPPKSISRRLGATMAYGLQPISTMPRIIWRGAISFGLVHIPVTLHAASVRRGMNFDLVDKRTADPIGYRKINKVTGKEVASEHITRAFEYAKGQYVMLADEEIKRANVESTQTVEITTFVDQHEVPFVFFDTPYYLAPDRRGSKVYTLLREALVRTNTIAIARVVLHTREHLAAVVPLGRLLILETLRWGEEVVEDSAIDAPATAKAAGVTTRELQMAEKLIADMSAPWDPGEYHDRFREDVEALVERKVKAGRTHLIEGEAAPPKRLAAPTSTEELAALLKDSLRALPPSERKRKPVPKRPAGKRSDTKSVAKRARAQGR